MSAPQILAIAADLAEAQPSADRAVRATLACLSCYPEALALLDAAERASERFSLALILRLHCGCAADVAEAIRHAARAAEIRSAA